LDYWPFWNLSGLKGSSQRVFFHKDKSRLISGLTLAFFMLGAASTAGASTPETQAVRDEIKNWGRNVVDGDDTTPNYSGVTAALQAMGADKIMLEQTVKSLHAAEEAYRAPLPHD